MASRKFQIPKDEYVISKPIFDDTQVNETQEPLHIEFEGSTKKEIYMISCDRLKMDEENSVIYGAESEESVSQLADEIRQNGFKSAIMAYPSPDEPGIYQIESGHRRFLAAQQAGLHEIPVILTEPPKTQAERRIRLISMNLHSRESLKPTVMARVIQTLLDANREERTLKGLPCDMATLSEITAAQVELSVKSLEKYRTIPRLNSKLQEYADAGISWSALVQAVTLPEDKQEALALAIKTEVERVGEENVSRQWIIAMINKMRQDLIGTTTKAKTLVKSRDGAKIVAKCMKDFDDIANGTAVFKESDKKAAIENLRKIRDAIDKKLEELS